MSNANFHTALMPSIDAILYGTFLKDSYKDSTSRAKRRGEVIDHVVVLSEIFSYAPYIKSLADVINFEEALEPTISLVYAVCNEVCRPFSEWVGEQISSTGNMPGKKQCREWISSTVRRLVITRRAMRQLGRLPNEDTFAVRGEFRHCHLERHREHAVWTRQAWSEDRSGKGISTEYWRWVAEQVDAASLELLCDLTKGTPNIFFDVLNANSVSMNGAPGQAIVVRRDLIAQEILNDLPSRIAISPVLLQYVPQAASCLEAMDLGFDLAKWDGCLLSSFLDAFSIANDPDRQAVIQFRHVVPTSADPGPGTFTLRSLWNAVSVDGGWKFDSGEIGRFYSDS